MTYSFKRSSARYYAKNKEKCDALSNAWRALNKDRKYKTNVKWRRKNPIRALFYAAQARAKKNNVKFMITMKDLILPNRCPVMGIPFVLNDGRMAPGKKNDSSPPLDRINSKKGYVKGNVQIISWRANRLKSDGTLTDFEKIVRHMKKVA